MRISGVYAILNLLDGKIYIGSAKYIKSRLGWHYRALENNKHHNILLKRAWDKYGEDSFIFFVLEATADHGNTWCIMRSDLSNGTTFLTPIFNKLSFHSAMRVVNHLNGGDRLTDDLLRVLEMCKV